MEFSPSGQLFAFIQGDNGPFFAVDTDFGSMSTMGTVNAPPTPFCGTGSSLSAGTIDPASGVFYSSRIDYCNSPPYWSDLVTIDLATGFAVAVGQLPAQTDAIAFACSPAVP
jgi:hypothetical protein